MNKEFHEFINSFEYDEDTIFDTAQFVMNELYPKAIPLEMLFRIIYLANRTSALCYGGVIVHDVPVVDSSMGGNPGFHMHKLKHYLDRSRDDIRSRWYKYFDTRYGKIRLRFEDPNPYFGELSINNCKLLKSQIERYLYRGGQYRDSVAQSLGALPEFPVMHGNAPQLREVFIAMGLDEEHISSLLMGAGLDFTISKTGGTI